jgi:hypothetical protein
MEIQRYSMLTCPEMGTDKIQKLKANNPGLHARMMSKFREI